MLARQPSLPCCDLGAFDALLHDTLASASPSMTISWLPHTLPRQLQIHEANSWVLMSAKCHLGKVTFLEVFDGSAFGQVFLESLPEVLDENILALHACNFSTKAARNESRTRSSKFVCVLDFIRRSLHRSPIICDLFLCHRQVKKRLPTNCRCIGCHFFKGNCSLLFFCALCQATASGSNRMSLPS